MIASACLLLLKMADFVLDGGSLPADNVPPTRSDCCSRSTWRAAAERPGQSWAQQMFNFPGLKGTPPGSTDLARLPAITPVPADKNADIITGSVDRGKE